MGGRKLPKNIVAGGGDLDERHFIGRLCTYTLPDVPQNGAKLVREWARNGLDVDDLPDARQPVHVFQSACRSVETRRRSNGHSVEVKVDEVLDDANECVYQVTRMVRDKAEKVIEHPKAMTVAFDKRTSTITVRELEDYDTMRGLEDAIRTHFEKNAKTVPGQKIRNAVRDTLLRVGAQNLRRKAGGLYFVPQTYRVKANGDQDVRSLPILDGIKAVLEALYGERADFYVIPCLSGDEERAMVRKHFAINANDKLEELLQKAVNRVRAGKGERGVRADLIANLHNERRRVLGAVEQFHALVGAEQDDVDANVKALDKALADLQDLAESS